MAWLFSLLILQKTGYLSAIKLAIMDNYFFTKNRCVYYVTLRHVFRRHVLPHLGTKCHEGSDIAFYYIQSSEIQENIVDIYCIFYIFTSENI